MARYTEPRRTGPLDYTGTRYTDEFDEAEDAKFDANGDYIQLHCMCWNADTVEQSPDLCARCQRLANEGIPT